MEHAGPSTPKRRTPWNTISARVISMVSRKGGVGKTTSAVNLGAAFALTGHTVLVIGVDPQCGVARTLGCGPEDLVGGLVDLFDQDLALTHLALSLAHSENACVPLALPGHYGGAGRQT